MRVPESEGPGDTWGSPKPTSKVDPVHTGSWSAGGSGGILQDRHLHSPGAEKRTHQRYNVLPTGTTHKKKLVDMKRKKKNQENEIHSQKKAVNKN